MCRPLGVNGSTKANFRSSSFYLAAAKAACWKCSDQTTVYCILLNNDYHERDDREGIWTVVKGTPVLLYDVEGMSKEPLIKLIKINLHRQKFELVRKS